MRTKRRYEIRLCDERLMTFSCVSDEGNDVFEID